MTKLIPDIQRALTAVGELLAAEGETAAVVVVGGAALNLSGIVKRTTRDVDVLAVADASGGRLRPPSPLPDALRRAVKTVARDFNLPADWLNTDVGGQWDTGLPPGLDRRLTWRPFGGLAVGIADRRDLVFLKLYAAADDTGPQSVHFQDLLALKPTMEETQAAARWARSQDLSAEFGATVDKVVAHVLAR